MYLDRYTLGNYNPGAPLLQQLLWYFVGAPIVKSYWLPFSGVKVWLLRRFGATIGTGVRIKPGVRIKFPWRLAIGDYVWLGEGTWIDNVSPVQIDSHSCLSQDVYLCTGNHDWTDPTFALTPAPIQIRSHCWIAARSVIGPGVTVHEGAVLGLGSVTGRSLDAMTIYAGNPAQPIRRRNLDLTAPISKTIQNI